MVLFISSLVGPSGSSWHGGWGACDVVCCDAGHMVSVAPEEAGQSLLTFARSLLEPGSAAVQSPGYLSTEYRRALWGSSISTNLCRWVQLLSLGQQEWRRCVIWWCYDSTVIFLVRVAGGQCEAAYSSFRKGLLHAVLAMRELWVSLFARLIVVTVDDR